MDTPRTAKIDLSQLVPNAIGMLAFDEKKNVIEASGIAKDRLSDVEQISQVKLDSEGFGLLQEDSVQVIIYKQEDKTLAVYTYAQK
ncbi:LAMI_0G11430g1_1 [Lachancea mirantina]|uniref:LAMI_0G11430g1_1 n=1 Tax=Lachancea mirantina TaxID=1230905 RepID=A0A1G4KB08_9SACH|nr:LAMI_0G11430g1_1 [Lachancea mirantina]